MRDESLKKFKFFVYPPYLDLPMTPGSSGSLVRNFLLFWSFYTGSWIQVLSTSSLTRMNCLFVLWIRKIWKFDLRRINVDSSFKNKNSNFTWELWSWGLYVVKGSLIERLNGKSFKICTGKLLTFSFNYRFTNLVPILDPKTSSFNKENHFWVEVLDMIPFRWIGCKFDIIQRDVMSALYLA